MNLLFKCKKCKLLKTRNQDGFFGDGKTRRYLDKDGKQWMGKLCPECVRTRAKTYMKKLRAKKEVTNA